MSAPSTNAAEAKPLVLGPMSKEGTVIIEVGLDHEKYYIHRALLVHHSEYFAKALRGSWKEAQEGIVKLEDIGTEEFNIFVHWLYSQKLPDIDHRVEWYQIINKPNEEAQDVLEAKVRAYGFGERFLAAGFRRAICEHLVDDTWYSHSEVWSPAVWWAFENLPSTSIMFQFLVDRFAECWNNDEDDEDHMGSLSKLPPAFVMRALSRFCGMRNERKWGDVKDRCYLEHTSDDEKEACSRLHMHYDEEWDYGYLN